MTSLTALEARTIASCAASGRVRALPREVTLLAALEATATASTAGTPATATEASASSTAAAAAAAARTGAVAAHVASLTAVVARTIATATTSGRVRAFPREVTLLAALEAGVSGTVGAVTLLNRLVVGHSDR